MSKVALVTGANSGLGFGTVKQLAARSDFGKVLLGVRSQAKGDEAIVNLEKLGVETAKLSVLVVDVSSVKSTNQAVDKLEKSGEKLDFLVLNAGMIGGKQLKQVEDSGMEISYAASLAGHSVMAIRLSKSGVMTEGSTIVFSGSEAATGNAPGMALQDVRKFAEKHFEGNIEKAIVCLARSEAPASYSSFNNYATLKAVMAWFVEAFASHLKQKGKKIRVFAISPGSTPDTNVSSNLPGWMRVAFTLVGKPMMKLTGKAHSIEVATQRYLDGMDLSESVSGHFFASPKKKLTGKLTDNSLLYDHFLQDDLARGAYKAITSMVGESL